MRRAILVPALLLLGTALLAGTFEVHPKRLQVGPNVTSIVAVDLNGDGLAEIVTSDRGRLADPREERPAQDQLSYLVGKGELEFEPRPQLRTGFGPYAIAVANIDALKAPDLVVANFLARRNRDITLLRNIGNHLFEPVHFSVPEEDLRYTKMRDSGDRPVFTIPGLTALAIADVDQDGFRDIIATGWSSDVLVLFPGAEDTYFAQAILFKAPGGPRDIQTADFDGDGHTDLATLMYSSHEVVLWRGDGKRGFREVDRFPSGGKLPSRLRLADMNGDGRNDLVVAHCHADDSIMIFYGEGGFRFGMTQEILLGKERRAIEHEIRDVVTGDFNNDGKTDLAVACFASRQVLVLMNRTKNGRLRQTFRQEAYVFEKGRPRALYVHDFNGDGAPDLAVALWEVNSLALLLGKP